MMHALLLSFAVALVASAAMGSPPVRIDLTDDLSRQVVVDREEGQYLGHVSTVLLDDGRTILAAYPKGHGRGPIVLKKSTDGGLTWSEWLEVPESWKTSKETPTLFKMGEAPGGEESIILFSGLYPIRAARSHDSGETWTELEPIGDFGGIVAMGDVAKLPDTAHGQPAKSRTSCPRASHSTNWTHWRRSRPSNLQAAQQACGATMVPLTHGK